MKTKALFLLALSMSLVGCNLGMAPSGGSKEEIEANFQKQSPQEQIRIIRSSPASADRKAQLVKEVEDRTGYHESASEGGPVAGGSQSNPAPGAAPSSGQ